MRLGAVPVLAAACAVLLAAGPALRAQTAPAAPPASAAEAPAPAAAAPVAAPPAAPDPTLAAPPQAPRAVPAAPASPGAAQPVPGAAGAADAPAPPPGAPQQAVPEEPRVSAEPPAPPAPGAPRVDPRADTGPIVRPPVQANDQWIYQRSNGKSSSLMRQTAMQVSADGIALRTELAGSPDTSTALYDREWNLVASGYNDYQPALRYYAFPLYAGKRWGIDSTVSNFGAGQTSRVKGEAAAVRWEQVEVGAGRFLALRIEIDIETADPDDPERKLRVRETHWYARTVLRAVKVESHSVVGDGAPATEVVELMSYQME